MSGPRILLGTVALALLTAAGCGSNNAGKIEGTKWRSKSAIVSGQLIPAGVLSLEFRPDGGLRYTAGPMVLSGTYTLGSGDTVTMNFDKKIEGLYTHQQTVRIDGDTLTLIDSDGTSLDFKRVRTASKSKKSQSSSAKGKRSAPSQPKRSTASRKPEGEFAPDQIVSAIGHWADASKTLAPRRSLIIRGAQITNLKFNHVWLASDASGEAASKATAANYVCIDFQFRLFGSGKEETHTYRSYNGGEPGSGIQQAILTDERFRKLPLVKFDSTSVPGRQFGESQVPSNSLIREVLVFKAPGRTTSLRLALPSSATTDKTSYWGVKIPAAMVKTGPPETGPPKTDLVDGAKTPGETSGDLPQIKAPPQPKDLKKSITDFKRGSGADSSTNAPDVKLPPADGEQPKPETPKPETPKSETPKSKTPKQPDDLRKSVSDFKSKQADHRKPDGPMPDKSPFELDPE